MLVVMMDCKRLCMHHAAIKQKLNATPSCYLIVMRKTTTTVDYL